MAFQKISESLQALRNDMRDVWNAFFDIKDEDSTGESVERVSDKIELRLWYFIVDYWLAALFAALVIAMTAWGFTVIQIFLAGWLFDFVVAMYFVVHERVFGTDISLGSDYRRAMDVLRVRRKLAWIIAMTGVLAKASVWDGPEQIVMFFRKEINTWLRVSVVIAALAAFQAAFWQMLWMLGYDIFVESENAPIYVVLAVTLIYVNQVRKYFGRS